MTQKQPKQSFFSRLLSAPMRVSQLETEKARLEAFLSTFPGEYCGIAASGHILYSENFCTLLDLASIQSLTDIGASLSPGDAAAFEGMTNRLQENGTGFVLTAKNRDESKYFKISGAKGEDLAQTDSFIVLWVEDITDETHAQSSYAEEKQEIESEFHQIRTALDSIPRPVWLRDPQQNIVWTNTTYCNFLNTDMPDVITQQKEITSTSSSNKQSGSNTNRLKPGKDLAAQALKENTVLETTAHGIFHGKRLLLKISEIPLGGLGMTLGIAYNITKEEELENELQRFQSSTNELMEQLHSAIALFDVDQKLEFYNPAFSQLWNLDSGWLNKKPTLGEIMEKLRQHRRLPEQADFRAFKQSWLDMFTNLFKPTETMLYLPDNTALRMLAFPHTMGGLMMTFEDVSSRLELESSYNTLMAVQKETLDNLGEGVAVYGSNGRLKLWNPAFTTMWNLHPEDVENNPHINRIIDKKKAFFTDDTWQARKSELTAMGLDRSLTETRIKRQSKTGTNELIDTAAVPLPDGGVLITFSDVTDKVAIEEALREKAEALETAEQLKIDFLANVSYQLRTPLNAIMGFAEILQNEYFGKLNKRQKDYTTDIQTASDTLLQLINDILDLSTLEAGYLTLSRSSFKISDMLDSIGTLVSDWGRKEKTKITIDYPTNIGSMTGDPRRIQQAIINVIRNALSYIKSDGKVTIGAARKKAEIHFTIHDSQSAITEADKAHIFKPFQRAKSGTKKADFASSTTSPGLGLSLVRSIVEAHGGTVNIQSDDTAGTTISLIIPLTSTKTSFKVPKKD